MYKAICLTMLFLIIVLNSLLIDVCIGNRFYNDIIVRPMSIDVLLVAIEDYSNVGLGNLDYAIDAMDAFENIMSSNVLSFTKKYNNNARPKHWWTEALGGENIISNYVYVLFYGHGGPKDNKPNDNNVITFNVEEKPSGMDPRH